MSVRKVRDAVVVMVAFLALIWILQVVNWADGYRLDTGYGILPHSIGRLPDIFTAPHLHYGFAHIEGNSLPLLVLGFLAAYRGIAKFAAVTLIVTVVSGLGVWLFQSGSELTVGASGIIFGYFGYVLLRGIFDRNLLDIGVGVVAGAFYWGILAVAIPGTPGISWIGHLGGLIGGVAAAWLLRAQRPSLAGAASGGSGGSGGGRGIGGGPSGRRAGGSGTGGAGAGGSQRPAAAPGGGANDGHTRPYGGTEADRLLREIDDLGI